MYVPWPRRKPPSVSELDVARTWPGRTKLWLMDSMVGGRWHCAQLMLVDVKEV
jgi:hypothetical protein